LLLLLLPASTSSPLLYRLSVSLPVLILSVLCFTRGRFSQFEAKKTLLWTTKTLSPSLNMPKSNRIPSTHRQSPFPIAQARQIGSVEPQPGHRNTINWSSADDEVLVAARIAGLNWQTTAAKHFPHKTANACRKRHERLIERRTHEDWTTKRLDSLAVEYMELRKEIWGPLATKIGERWSVVEAKVS
jgi:hypothetical protein